MARRMFPIDPPRITFTKDFRQLGHGDLRPGRRLTLVYDAERLPDERSNLHGSPTWTIRAFCRFVPHGSPRTLDLHSETGTIRTKTGDDPGEGTMMLGHVEIPTDAEFVETWFLNTGRSGREYWDSDFGGNYLFRFVTEDLHVTTVSVEPAADEQVSCFRIDVASQPAVADLAVDYRIMNDGNIVHPGYRMNLQPQPASGALPVWSGTAAVPQGAVIGFTLSYRVGHHVHTDTNSGRGYLSWAGAVRDVEAGVL